MALSTAVGWQGPLSDQDFQARLDEATQLHDEGRFDAALAAFDALLQARPDDSTVLCEMGNTYLAAQRPKDAVRVSARGLEQKSANVAFCSTVLGSAYDSQGELQAAERVFQRAVKNAPDNAMLRFNFGVNLSKQGRNADAVKQYERALLLRPEHASSWRALGLAWQSAGERGRAFAAFSRFLTLEPDSPRSADAAKSLHDLLFQGVTDEGPDPETGQGRINISLAPPKKRNDPAGAHAMALGVVAASRYTEDWKDKTDNQFFAHAFETTLSILEELGASDRKEDAFWREQVLAYFREARGAGHLEAMAWSIRRSLTDPEIDHWIEEHAEQTAKFREWSNGWKW